MANEVGRAPKHHRVADTLRTEIRTEVLSPGERLPAETALADRFRVSLPTIRQGLSVLRAEGLIESIHTSNNRMWSRRHSSSASRN